MQTKFSLLALLLCPLAVLSQVAPVVPAVPGVTTTTAPLVGAGVTTTNTALVGALTTTTPLVPIVATTTTGKKTAVTTATTPAVAVTLATTTTPVVAAVDPAIAANTNTKATTVWVTDALGKVSPSIFSQQFSANGVAGAPSSGVIGMGTQTGEIGVVRTREADSSAAVAQRVNMGWTVSLVVGAVGFITGGILLV
ncbi:hypothetical protein EDC01DRAFT_81555 [Geopyxis carbonaria]|nr:hypothetical protein EDC01DRAFT_81555 [Geopyxis carbonaria]